MPSLTRILPNLGLGGLALPNIALAYQRLVKGIYPANLIGYWPLAVPAGAVASEVAHGRDGSLTACTLGAAGIGDEHTAITLDGSTSYGDIYSAALAGAFNGKEGSLIVWGRVSAAGVWIDGQTSILVRISADGSNVISVQKNPTNNQLGVFYVAGGTSKNTSSTVLAGTVSAFVMGMSWSLSGNQMVLYLNGSVAGSVQTGLGTWEGSPGANTTLIGAISKTPANVWSGTLAHCALWDAPLPASAFARLALVP